jgi:hypothetical protein
VAAASAAASAIFASALRVASLRALFADDVASACFSVAWVFSAVAELAALVTSRCTSAGVCALLQAERTKSTVAVPASQIDVRIKGLPFVKKMIERVGVGRPV